MYESCVNCPKIGVSCDGPNFVAMSANELIAWCKARKKHLDLSNQRIAELANVSKGTVDGLLAAAHADFRYETIRPILKVLIGGDWSGDPCPDPTSDERAHYEEKIHQLESEIAWRDDKIKHLTDTNESMKTLITNTNKRNKEQTDFLQHAIGNKNRTILILAILLALCLGVIIAALIIDRLNSDIGFFWLESLFKPHSINEFFQQWNT